MKKYLIVLLIAAAFAFVSCEKVPEVSLDKVSEEMGYRGGVLEFDVTANCDWEIICSSDDIDLLTVSQWTGGPGTQTITVNVDRNQTNSILKHYFTAVAHGSKRDALSSLTLTQGAPAYVQFNKNAFTADYIGGEYKFTIASNFPWEISIEGEGVTAEPMSGEPLTEEDNEATEEDAELDNTITVTVDEYEGDVDRSFIINVVAHGNEGDITDKLVITQTSPSLIIGNREYRIKKMGDGRWWMIDNLCYSNKGITIGDGICGVWYPCSDFANEPDNTVDGIIKKGLLYTDAVAFNTKLTKTTAKKQEGVQGLCPSGWHLPTLKEWMSLVGKFMPGNTQISMETVSNAPYYDEVNDCGSLERLMADGFISGASGYVQGTGENFSEPTTSGYNKTLRRIRDSYFFSSTHCTDTIGTGKSKTITGYWYALKINTNDTGGKVPYANVQPIGDAIEYNSKESQTAAPVAASVRCIKD